MDVENCGVELLKDSGLWEMFTVCPCTAQRAREIATELTGEPYFIPAERVRVAEWPLEYQI